MSQLEHYYQLLRHWNKRINLTALQLEPLTDTAIDRLFVEPLRAAAHIPDSELTCIDLGSGGGSPAIPLKIMRPLLKLTLVESRSRKVSFLREVTRELALRDVVVICGRFEAIARNPELVGSGNIVTLRAVRLDSASAGAIRQLLSRGGELFVFGGSTGLAQVPSGFRQRVSMDLVQDRARLVILAAN